KPVLTVRDGVLEAYARFRTQRQAFDALCKLALRAGENARGIRMAIAYAVHDAAASQMAAELRAALDLDVLMVTEVGAALAAFTGPGALGISWYVPQPCDSRKVELMLKIITGTTAGLPPEELEKYGIPMVPPYVHFGDEAVRDVFDIGTE